nr:NADH dehydrogenase subunit 4 [Propeamussium sp. mt1]
MFSVLFGLYPSSGIFSCWYFSVLLVMLAPSLSGLSGGGYVLSMNWVVDEWSMPLVFLGLWLGSLMGLYMSGVSSYCIWGVTASCVLSFSCYNFFGFYVFFELCLVPVSILMLKWGYSPERLSAVFYLLLYTLLGSFPFLFFISYCLLEDGHVFMGISKNLLSGMGVLGFLVVVGFLIKLPMFPFHLWLTKAHVEAPTTGSMVLAGILLKLGGLGLIRVMFSYGCLSYFLEIFLLGVALWGAVLAFFMAMSQLDSKALVAYSSVSHMALVLVGVISGSFLGLMGSLFLMVLHGLYSSGQFSVLGDMSVKGGTRSFLLLKGFMMVSPTAIVWWFVLCCCSMGCPPFCSFLVEGFMGMLLSSISFYLVFLFGFMIFLSGACSFVLYSGVAHGSVGSVLRPELGYFSKVNLMGIFHSGLLVILFFFPGFMF